MTSTVLAVLMVRNEGRILRRCIDALKDIADIILVVDTGSTDDTVTVAEDQGCISASTFGRTLATIAR